LKSAAASPLRAIQAAVLRQRGGPLTIETLAMEGPRDDEALVRLTASGICHTDIAYCDHWYDGGAPVVLGHEGAGVVEHAGKRLRGLRPGDHVVLSYQSCGRCPACRRGRPTACALFYELNFDFQRADGSNALQRSGVRGHFFGQSSFATHTLATARNMVRVPPELPLPLLAPLGCGMQTGAGAILNSLAVPPGAGVAIFGSGAVGLAAVMAAGLAGAEPLIAVDIIPARLALARELGATHAFDSRRADIARRIRGITGNGVDYVLEITGDPGMHRLALAVLKAHGRLALFGGETGTQALTEGRQAVGIIQGDAVPQHFIPRLIDLHRAGQFPFERLVRFYDFRDINRAMADARKGKTVKPVLQIGST